ncbi:MAG: hypothetical protein COB02_05115 [Candidatus Cloacimonadota bacterium]|nr:MAG: hypothetical protein COB02_05115 [Candidatus Cloacimonadota bacterium]
MKYLLTLSLLFLGCSRDNDHPAFSLGQTLTGDFAKFHLKQLVGTIETVDSNKKQLDSSGIFYSYSPTMEFIGKMGPFDVKIRMDEDSKLYVIKGRFGPIGSINGRAYLSKDNGIYMDFYDQNAIHYRGTLK